MTLYITRRLVALIPILFGVSVLVFVIMATVPGDPALLYAGSDATQAEVENVRHALGLDQPIYVRYGIFLGNLAHGDLGESIRSRRPVADEIGDRLPYTMQLAFSSLLVALLIGLPAGIIAALKRNTIWDTLSMLIAIVGVSAPGFWIGMMLILLFGVELGWLPTSGTGSWAHLIMPSIALGLGSAAIVARQTRSAMLEVLGKDYIRTARAKGLRERVVILRHAVRNAMIPVVTIVGLQLGTMLGGSVIIEMVFAWPGLGRALVQSIGYRDFPMVQVSIIILAAGFVLVNLVVDVLYGVIDPRIRRR